MADLRLESEQNKILSMSAAPLPLASYKVVQNAGLQRVLMLYKYSIIHVFCLFFLALIVNTKQRCFSSF